MSIKKVTVGTEAIQISRGLHPKTLQIYNNSASVIYLTTDPQDPIGEGYPIAAGGQYKNDYAKGNYYLISASSGLDVRVEQN